MQPNIEAEVRSLISKEQFENLLQFFKKNGQFVKQDFQESHYFDSKQDLRIQKNNYFSKIWLKKGKLHDEHREEIEIRFDKNEFPKLQELFSSLDYNVQIKWFRERHEFNWQGIDVSLDYTKGYGYIIELEKLCSIEEQEKVVEELKQKLKSLDIELTPREEFDKKFQHYKQNWKQLTKNQ